MADEFHRHAKRGARSCWGLRRRRPGRCRLRGTDGLDDPSRRFLEWRRNLPQNQPANRHVVHVLRWRRRCEDGRCLLSRPLPRRTQSKEQGAIVKPILYCAPLSVAILGLQLSTARAAEKKDEATDSSANPSAAETDVKNRLPTVAFAYSS